MAEKRNAKIVDWISQELESRKDLGLVGIYNRERERDRGKESLGSVGRG